jgi:hypothetical protein
VRRVFMHWAVDQPGPVKEAWLVPWERLTGPERAVDEAIGVRVYEEAYTEAEADHRQLEWAVEAVLRVAGRVKLATIGLGPALAVAEQLRQLEREYRRLHPAAVAAKVYDPLAGPTELQQLYEVCSDEELAVLDALAIRAGLQIRSAGTIEGVVPRGTLHPMQWR